MGMPHYVPEYFYLGNGINKVDLMDVYKLADFAITLIPTFDDNKVEDCIGDDKINECIKLLKAHMDNYVSDGNYDNENMNNLAKCYYLLNADLIGRELLFRTIHFKFWNKFLLKKGLSPDIIMAFSKANEDLKMIEQIGTTINKEAVLRNYDNSNSKGK